MHKTSIDKCNATAGTKKDSRENVMHTRSNAHSENGIVILFGKIEIAHFKKRMG